MLTYEACSSAPTQAIWRLVAEPARWSSWAPHLRGASGLGDVEVEAGRRGVVWLLAVPVPVEVVAKTPGRSWHWRVGGVEIGHEVRPEPDGSRVIVTIAAPDPAEAVLKLTYGPVVALLVRNLARVADRA